MDFPSANVNELLCMAEAVPNFDMKKTIHNEIILRIYKKQFNLINNTELERFDALSSLIYNDEELFKFQFLTRKRSFKNIELNEVNNNNNNNIDNIGVPKSSENSESVLRKKNKILNNESVQIGGGGGETAIDMTKNILDLAIPETSRNLVISNEPEPESETVLDLSNKNKNNNENNIDLSNNNENNIDLSDDDEIMNNNNNNKTNYSLNDYRILEEAFQCRIITYSVENKNKDLLCFKQFLNDIKDVVLNLINKEIEKHTMVKINFCLYGKYFKPLDQGASSDTKSFHTPNIIFTMSSACELMYLEIIERLISESEDFQENGSGWSLENILNFKINVNKCNPLRASSYIPLPLCIRRKNAVINVKNEDQECFKWAMLAGLHINCNLSDRENMSSYSGTCVCMVTLNFENVTFPMDIKKISHFEIKNDVSINIYGVNENNTIIGPLHYTKDKKEKHFNLLLFGNFKTSNYHYCYIKSMSALCGSQLNKHKSSMLICDGCLIFFYNEAKLAEHQLNNCSKIKTILPEDNEKVEFRNWERKMKVSFCVGLIFIIIYNIEK